MRDYAALCLAIAAAALAPAASASCDSLDSLRWLLGEWEGDGPKTSFRETWVELGPTTFEGRGVERTKADPGKESSEELRLVEMGDGVFYIAKVGHNDLPVAFRLSECEAGRFAFVNAGHDFPRRLDYVRQGNDRLSVRVSDGGDKGFTLDFARTAATGARAQAVLEAEDARLAAMVAADPEAMRETLAEDLAYVHSTGRVEDREALIQGLVSGRLRYLAIQPSERQVSFPGAEVALVQGLARIQARAGEQTVDFPARYLAVYRRDDGTWRMTAWQSLRLP